MVGEGSEMISRRESIAFEKGYRCVGLSIIGPKGRALKIQHGRDHYAYFRIKVSKNPVQVLAHRFSAFQKFGDAIYEDGVECRHKVADRHDFSEGNVILGTPSQNSMDRPISQRQRQASNPKHNAASIREFHAVEGSYRLTMEHFGIRSKGTLHYILNNRQFDSKNNQP